jgi:3-methyladenine DNA glycosylase/8-oxoguanine DNA glycosylase
VPAEAAAARPAGSGGVPRASLGAVPPAATAPAAAAPIVREWRAPFAVDVRLTLSVHRRGSGDPAFRIAADGSVWRTSLTPDGPGTLRILGPPAAAGPAVASAAAASSAHAGDAPAGGTLINAAAWGPGAAWLLAAVPDLLGAGDDPAGFDPAHPLLREMSARHPGLRVGRSGRVLEALVPAVLEQKVVGAEAWRAWRLLLLRFGGPAPGPAPDGMRVFPPARTWLRMPSWEWHRAGVEGVRARTVANAARVARRLEEIMTMPPDAADRRLRALPGIGPWTSAEVRQRACGDPDAVSVGDYHLPADVGWALAGRKVDDAGMLELLAPYAGHRHRATRLVELSGVHPPRRGPRLAPRDYRSF